MPAPELVEHIAKAIEETIECGSPNAVALVAATAHEKWLASEGLSVVNRSTLIDAGLMDN